MTGPVKFDNVHYYLISGNYSFGGTLIVAKGWLYFFPQVDLEAQRNQRTNTAYRVAGLPGVILVKTFFVFYDLLQSSHLTQSGLWREGISDEQFRQLADTRIAQLKEESKPFLGSLPTPTRIRVDEIADLKLSAFGKLSFFAQSDRQDFKVSLFQGKALREALAVAGFGHV